MATVEFTRINGLKLGILLERLTGAIMTELAKVYHEDDDLFGEMLADWDWLHDAFMRMQTAESWFQTDFSLQTLDRLREVAKEADVRKQIAKWQALLRPQILMAVGYSNGILEILEAQPMYPEVQDPVWKSSGQGFTFIGMSIYDHGIRVTDFVEKSG